MNTTKVYYDKKIDQLVLVHRYQASRLYSYSTELLWTLRKEHPKKYKTLVYIGEFAGDLYEMD